MAYTAQITQNDQNRRMDRILRKALPELPLSAIHKLLRKGQVYIDGKPVDASFKPQAGSVLEISSLEVEIQRKADTEKHISIPELSPLDILYEHEALLFINKKPGIPVHGKHSLDEAVQGYLKSKLPPSLSFKSGPLHRLDQGTSGIIAFSKNLAGAQRFSEALRQHRLSKWYLAILQGTMTEPVQWNDVLLRDQEQHRSLVSHTASGGKEARTTLYPLFYNPHPQKRFTLVLINLGTGRTHQIRVQAASHGYPLAGDIKYGAKKQAEPWFLHAYALGGLGTLNLGLPNEIQAPLSKSQLNLLKSIFSEPAQLLFLERLYQTPPIKDLLDAIIK